MDNQKGQFKSNFGFLMAAVGSAVGLGNLWGFPYKMLGEFAIGRKGQKAAIGSYEKIDRRFAFNGWIATLSPFFLLTFYCVLGGYVLKYLVANIGDIFGLGF